MTNWKEMLDQIVARELSPPSHARLLRLPPIDGWEPGRVWCAWEVDRELLQPQGNLFGGYVSALADEMLGLVTASIATEGETFATSDFSVHFLRPIRSGTLSIEASVLHRGRSTAHVEVTFTDADGRLVAKARATQIMRRPPASDA